MRKTDFSCKCGCGKNQIKESVVKLCKNIEKEVGMKVTVTSGYRCPTHNSAVVGDSKSIL